MNMLLFCFEECQATLFFIVYKLLHLGSSDTVNNNNVTLREKMV